MTTKPIGDYFQNGYNARLGLLNHMDYGDLAELQMFILQASVTAKVDGSNKLDMLEAVDHLESDSLPVHGGIEAAIAILQDFPSVDALNLVRAIVDMMEAAKVN